MSKFLLATMAAAAFASPVAFAPVTAATVGQDAIDACIDRIRAVGGPDGQDLYVRVAANGPNLAYAIYNPDGSVLLDEVSAAQEYRGELWQSGDHTVQVYNMSNAAQSYNVIFGIE
jgi:hypothetical protein